MKDRVLSLWLAGLTAAVVLLSLPRLDAGPRRDLEEPVPPAPIPVPRPVAAPDPRPQDPDRLPAVEEYVRMCERETKGLGAHLDCREILPVYISLQRGKR